MNSVNLVNPSDAKRRKMPVTKLAVRSSSGVEIWSACGATDLSSLNKEPYKPFDQFQRDETKMARCFCFSPCGKYFSWTNSRAVNVCTTNNWKTIHELARPRAFYLKFSPKGTFLMTWEQYVVNKETQEGAPNLFIYNTETGEEVFSIIQKRQTDWEPNWSLDESLVALMIGGEVLFYEPNSPDAFTKFVRKLGGKNGSVSMSPVNYPPHIAFYVPGVKAAPSMCRLYKYPNLETNQPVATKSFFQADRIEMMWNKKGSGLLILTSTEVDQTGVSYYGKQALHFISIKGDSCAVTLNADGPIHSVAWSPKSNEFCVVYGYIPAKATLFNLKCDPVFDFGTGVRNSIHFNPFGNLILFGGFGNLRGNIEVWDLKEKKEVSKSQAQDTTLLDWAPTGDIYFTATCAPRLRMSNGFKIWHYSGALLSETHWPEKQELLELTWQTFADGSIPENVISYEKIEGITSSQPTASAAKYVPPNIRNLPPGVEPSAPIIPGLPPDYKSSKYDSRNKRNNNRRNYKPKPGNEEGGQQMNEDGTPKHQNNKKPRERGPRKPKEPRENNDANAEQPAEGGDAAQDKPAKPKRRQQQRPRKSESSQNPDANGETETGDTEKTDKPPRRPQKKREPRISTGDNSDKSKTPPNTQNQENEGTTTPKPSRRERRAIARKSESQENDGENQNQQKTDKPERFQKSDKPRPQKPRHNSTNEKDGANQQQQQQPSDPDKEIKKKINKKLKDIKVLKEKLEKGEKLDANQMTKINAESSLIQQLKSLKVS